MTRWTIPSLRVRIFLSHVRIAALCLPFLFLGAGCRFHSKPKAPPKPVELAYKAVCNGRLDDLKKVLDKRVYRNMELSDGSTLFHAAAMRGHRDIVEYLMPCVTNINFAGPGGMTPLHLAAAKGHADLVRFFLDKGADPDAGSQDSRTPLHLAAADGRTDIARLLLDKGADINARDGSGFTPLHWAAIKAQKEMVELLLERKADFTVECRKGRTPLWYANVSPEVEAILARKREFRRIAILCEPAPDSGAALEAAATGLERLLLRQLEGFYGVVTYPPQDVRRAWLNGTNAPAKAPEPAGLLTLAGRLEADRVADIRLTRAGGKLTVEASLFDATNNAALPLLSASVADETALATLDQKLANEIVARLDVRTSGTVARVSTDNPEAFRLFAKGAQRLAAEAGSPSLTTNPAHLAAAGAFFAGASQMDPAFLAASIDAASAFLDIRRLDPSTNITDLIRPYVQAAENAASNHPSVLVLAGRMAALQDAFINAFQAYDHALALNRHLADARFHRAIALRSQKRLDEAIAGFLLVLRLHPNDARTYAEMALALAHNGNWKNAVTQCEKTITLDPHIPEVYSTLAVSHWQLKNYDYAWKTIRLAKHFGHEDAIDKKFIETLKKETPKKQSASKKEGPPAEDTPKKEDTRQE